VFEVTNQVLEHPQLTIVSTLMDQVVPKSVVARHEIKHLWLREFLNDVDELSQISLLNGLHNHGLVEHVFFLLLLLLEKNHCLILLQAHFLLVLCLFFLD